MKLIKNQKNRTLFSELIIAHHQHQSSMKSEFCYFGGKHRCWCYLLAALALRREVLLKIPSFNLLIFAFFLRAPHVAIAYLLMAMVSTAQWEVYDKCLQLWVLVEDMDLNEKLSLNVAKGDGSRFFLTSMPLHPDSLPQGRFLWQIMDVYDCGRQVDLFCNKINTWMVIRKHPEPRIQDQEKENLNPGSSESQSQSNKSKSEVKLSSSSSAVSAMPDPLRRLNACEDFGPILDSDSQWTTLPMTIDKVRVRVKFNWEISFHVTLGNTSLGRGVPWCGHLPPPPGNLWPVTVTVKVKVILSQVIDGQGSPQLPLFFSFLYIHFIESSLNHWPFRLWVPRANPINQSQSTRLDSYRWWCLRNLSGEPTHGVPVSQSTGHSRWTIAIIEHSAISLGRAAEESLFLVLNFLNHLIPTPLREKNKTDGRSRLSWSRVTFL